MNDEHVCLVVSKETKEACGKPAVKTVDVKADVNTHPKLYRCGSSVVRVPVCSWHAARFAEDKQSIDMW